METLESNPVSESDLDKLGQQVFGEKPKKKRVSLLFLLIIVMAVISTGISIYSIRRAEKELGFESTNNIPLIIKQNYEEFLKGK